MVAKMLDPQRAELACSRLLRLELGRNLPIRNDGKYPKMP